MSDSIATLRQERDAARAREAALTDVLKAITASPEDPQPVFDTIMRHAMLICRSGIGGVFAYDGHLVHLHSFIGPSPEKEVAFKAAFPRPLSRDFINMRSIIERRTIHIRSADYDSDPDLTEAARETGERSLLTIPLMRNGLPIGSLGVAQMEADAFTDAQVSVLQAFAEQAVIAITTAEMMRDLETRTVELTKSVAAAEAALSDLKRAQDRLVQSEKMASLGQLTAGIAHEIKNPLNFVNNFADLSVELLDELRDAVAHDQRDEIEDLTTTLKSNLDKIAQHGRRADSIVKNMLLHSRASTGEARSVDLNATVEEALTLAYHGARAATPGFNITLERDFDPTAGPVELYPQEITRVLVNLFGNGFYAASKRASEPGFDPILRVSTSNLGDQVEIRVRDNGIGMTEAVKAKIFEPFFTTKPAGEGTGLGLSLSFDIIVKQHAGQITVASQINDFTEFTITLPRKMPAGAKQ